MRRRRLSWLDALLLVGFTTGSVVLLGAVLVRWVEPDRYPDLGSGLWWAITTITTVGYGDLVPATTPGRLVAAALMIVGIGCFAFLTAVAASAIVVEDLAEEEREFERESSEILGEVRRVAARLDHIEQALTEARAGEPATTRRAPSGRIRSRPLQ